MQESTKDLKKQKRTGLSSVDALLKVTESKI